MKPLISTSILCLFVCCATAQFRRDVRNCPLPPEEEPRYVLAPTCCCENVWRQEGNSGEGNFSYNENDFKLYINKQNAAGGIVDGLLDQMCVGSVIKIWQQSDPTVYRYFLVVYMESNDPIYQYTTILIDQNGELVKYEDFCFEFDKDCTNTIPYIPLAGTDPGAPVSGAVEVDTPVGDAFIYPMLSGIGTGSVCDSNETRWEVSCDQLYGYTYDAAGNQSEVSVAPLFIGLATSEIGPNNSYISMEPDSIRVLSPQTSFSGDVRFMDDIILDDMTGIYGDTLRTGSNTASRIQFLPDANGVLALTFNGAPCDAQGNLTAQIPHIAHANAGDIVAKFNLLLDELEAAGLMAP